MVPHHARVLRHFAIILPALLIPSVASLRAFLLVGQSNMEGKGSIAHLEQLLNDPTTRNTYQHLKTGTEWTERDDVTIKFNESQGEGKLTVGYGIPSDRFGPELEFGNVVGDAFNDEHILLIKCAWGGSDLAVDFRPPSSGLGNYSLCNGDGCTPHDPLDYGTLYRRTKEVVLDTLEHYNSIVQQDGPQNLFNVPNDKCSLSGIVWFQGWNDMSNSDKRDEYGYNLANLIRDMRADFGTPNLPFIVGELGQAGLQPDARIRDKHFQIRQAQRSVTELPEFQGNVLFVETSHYVINDGESFDAMYHYYGRADTFFHIGQAFGDAMLELIGMP